MHRAGDYVNLAIEDYGLIGNTRTAALVGRNGSVDWLCVPRFDSAACFAALLGDRNNGRWLIEPAGDVTSVKRRYRGDTLILETTFELKDGSVTLIDFMPIRKRDDQVDLARIVRCNSGTVTMRTEFLLRFGYGHDVPWIRRADYGLRAIAGPDAMELRTPIRLIGHNLAHSAEFTLTANQEVPFVLTWYPSHLTAPRIPEASVMLAEVEKWWTEWSARCKWTGQWRDAVMRSLITLKALSFAPTGGMVAAPTTSLPEAIGGVRNWDYRYCWLRDATLTLYALLIAGYTQEARAWREWLLRAVAGHPQEMQIMYGLAGERQLTEGEVPWLAGYANSKPVRIGNAAHQQFQLDVYGEVMDTMHVARKHRVPEQQYAWSLQKRLMDYLESVWDQPDEGIWEVRGPRRHFTHSKVMAWVAVDRAVKAVEKFKLTGPVEQWRALRQVIHDDVCRNGYNANRNAFMQYYGANTLDASILMMPLVGFLPASDPRVEGTLKAIGEELMVDGFVMRYSGVGDVDGLPSGEGAFLACTYWYADNLSMLGRMDEAREIFERLLGISNDLGLLAEEYDPHLKRQVGNFPQAFTHVCLINTAHNLGARKKPAVDRAVT
ncbi:MAG: glycoside hydrolase family 15 protein [Candidatus Binataceae bacterium]